MNFNKVYGLIGIGMKSGNLVSGEFSTEKTIKAGRACLVIIAEDASNNTKKKFTNMCTYYKVPIYIFGEKIKLAQAMGKEERTSLALLEPGLAKSIETQLKTEV